MWRLLPDRHHQRCHCQPRGHHGQPQSQLGLLLVPPQWVHLGPQPQGSISLSSSQPEMSESEGIFMFLNFTKV